MDNKYRQALIRFKECYLAGDFTQLTGRNNVILDLTVAEPTLTVWFTRHSAVKYTVFRGLKLKVYRNEEWIIWWTFIPQLPTAGQTIDNVPIGILVDFFRKSVGLKMIEAPDNNRLAYRF